MSELTLADIFSDHAVFQRDQPVPVWGRARPGASVTVEFGGCRKTCVSDTDGKWRVDLDAMTASATPRAMTARCEGATIQISDALVGDVWLCSGQSNMDWPCSAPSGMSEEDLADTNLPEIRLLHVTNRSLATPRDDLATAWVTCTSESAATFSALGFLFGRRLHRHLGIPIGLIHSAWGGTCAEAWTSEVALRADSKLGKIWKRWQTACAELPSPGSPEHRCLIREWEDNVLHRDEGNRGEAMGWAGRTFDDSEWDSMELPSYWENKGLNIDGSVWFRKTVPVPAAWRGQELELSLGPIDDYDLTYVDGTLVGDTGPETENASAVPRRYKVPGRLVQDERLTVAVRVFDRMGMGGICGAAAMLYVQPVGRPHERIRLAGPWRYKVEKALSPKPWIPPPANAGDPNAAAGLFNAMIHPLIPYAIRGAAWYQGESNADRAAEYRSLLSAMIGDWRQRWGFDFPFLIVQLANYMQRATVPRESAWAELREAQAQVADRMPATGLVVTGDCGDGGDIHPRNKPVVAWRLFLLARALAHGEDVEAGGPMLARLEVDGSALRIFFHRAHGLHVRGGPPISGLAIAGEDGRFVWADARIDEARGCLVCTSPQVPRPAAIRYGWDDNPLLGLFNAYGLPAAPFQADVTGEAT